MHAAFGRVRRRIARLRTVLFVGVRVIARSEITELNSETSFSLRTHSHNLTDFATKVAT